jgi:hypothetical protein
LRHLLLQARAPAGLESIHGVCPNSPAP